jgi:hypothetical protein
VKSRYGWKGKKVRAIDGRTGVITHEGPFGHWLDLIIQCDDGTQSKVSLNARGKDSGDHAWQWYCDNFMDGPAWLPLTDQSPAMQMAPALIEQSTSEEN